MHLGLLSILKIYKVGGFKVEMAISSGKPLQKAIYHKTPRNASLGMTSPTQHGSSNDMSPESRVDTNITDVVPERRFESRKMNYTPLSFFH